MSKTSKSIEKLSPLKRAYLALEQAEARVKSLEGSRREGIAVIGMGCRFPGSAVGPEGFWDLLASGRDAIEEVPASRWDVEELYDPDPDAPGKISSRYGGFLEGIDRFDAALFGISPREAQSMDPQQRLLLEVGHEALEHAGAAGESLADSSTGVFMAIANGDYYCLLASQAREKIDAYLGTGTSPNAAAGRLSYVFGLRGPCVAVDTACSSSLVAVHLACQSLRGGECDMALAGGVNVMLLPDLSITFSRAHMLSGDGRCKTFDAAADGYGRGEGVGVIVLKRLSDAIAAGDHILAVIRGSAVNQDGPSSGLTVPNGPSQQEVIRRALALGEIGPHQVGYLEAHGTGTSLGDPIEMGALGAVFADRPDPLWVGSVKTNIGHLEAAAGIAGVIKVILSLEHEEIPPHLHFHEPSPQIPWSDLPVRIPGSLTAWPRGERRRLAGVSSFGFTGINGHVVLEEAPETQRQAPPERRCELLAISARSRQGLQELAARYVAYLARNPELSLGDLCFTAAGGRWHYEHRVAVVAETLEGAGRALEAFVRGEAAEGLFASPAESEAAPAAASGNRKELLAATARLYVAGQEVDWTGLFDGGGQRKIPLPTYPFQRRRYWTEASGPADAVAAAEWGESVHPLLGRRVRSAAAPGLVQFESRLSARQPGYLTDHRVAGSAVLPATATMEMALAAAREAEPKRELTLEGLALEQALSFPEGQSRVVQVVLSPEEWGYGFELFSRPPAGSVGEGSPQWTRHARGRLAEVAQKGTDPRVDLAALKRGCGEEVSLEGFYEGLRQFGLQYGPRFRGLKRLWRGDGEVLGQVELPEEALGDLEDHALPPALIDACLHVTVDLGRQTSQRDGESEAGFVPVGLERLRVFGSPPGALWSHARLREAGRPEAQDRHTLDIDLIDGEGRLVVRLEGLQTRRVDLSRMVVERWAGGDRAGSEAVGPPLEIAAELQGLSAGEQRARIVGFLEEEVAKILKLSGDERPERDVNLLEMGLDSLMAVDFLYRINRGVKVNLPMQKLLENPVIDRLADAVADELNRSSGTPEGDEPPDAAAALPEATGSSVWLPHHRLEGRAAVRLFCFAEVGTGASVFSAWADLLRPRVDVCAVELPGSGTREEEPAIDAWGSLIETLGEEILDYLDRPFALLGYGSGSLIAFEAAHFVRQRFGLEPIHLFVSAARAPDAAAEQAGSADADAGRAGMQPYATTTRPPLESPITAFFGSDDASPDRADLQRWCDQTQSGFRLEPLAGLFASHVEAPQQMLRIVAEALGERSD